MTSINHGGQALGTGSTAWHSLIISQPHTSLSAGTLMFPSESPGSPSSSQTETVTNDGAVPLEIGQVTIIGSDGDEFCNDATGVCSPRDSDGHGTHTLTTAAGDCVDHAMLYGVDRGPVCGLAPGAWPGKISTYFSFKSLAIVSSALSKLSDRSVYD